MTGPVEVATSPEQEPTRLPAARATPAPERRGTASRRGSRWPATTAAIWRDWADDLRGGGPIESGHHMAEEAPDELAAALIEFLEN